MISSNDPAIIIDDLRFVLETMEERSHLGLDGDRAERLRMRIVTRIKLIEGTIPKSPNPVAVAEIPE